MQFGHNQRNDFERFERENFKVVPLCNNKTSRADPVLQVKLSFFAAR